MVKMKDVAERAGVSTMTVSLALSDSPRLSSETRRRVLEVVKELQYSPNARGRALRSGFTNVIGLYTGFGAVNVRLPFFTEVVSGLQEGCELVKKDLLLHGVFHGGGVDDIFTELADGRIDGLVVNMPQDNPLAVRLAESGFPIIAIADSLLDIPSIIVDDAAGSRLLVEHLRERGHRRVVYLNSQARPLSAIRRREAFLLLAAEMGMEVEQAYYERNEEGDSLFFTDLLRRMESDRPSAIVCWNDQTAYEILADCHRYRVRVPDDIAVVGFDGSSSTYANSWFLTTIRAPWAEAARTAVLYLDQLLKGESVPEETVLPVQFVQGHTT
ncbi:MAG: transcriptional regulator, LacI family [Chthonomonadales bacterium]|nr:transcriptional regulator, LacI family [Chthonomonadales bacterium]